MRRRVVVGIVVASAAGIAGWWRARRPADKSERSDAMDNADRSRRIVEELFNSGNESVADELVAPDAQGHDAALPEARIGPEGLKEAARGYRGAFPDLKVTVEQTIAEGDHVATR